MKHQRTNLFILIGFIVFASCQNTPEKNTNIIQKTIPEAFHETMAIEDSSTSIFEQNISSTPNKQEKKAKINPLKDLRDSSKLVQHFIIKSNNDTTILANKGTVLYIPSDIFEQEDGNSLPQNSNINLTIEEYYSTSDMLLNNLSTVSRGNLLETGGMLNIQAKFNKKDLRIKNGRSYSVVMSNTNRTERMRLFYGEESNERIDWRPSNANNFFLRNNYTRFYTGASVKKISKLKKRLKYPKEAYKKDIKGMVYVKCIIDKDGVLRNPVIIKSVSDILNEEVIKALKGYSGFDPATYDEQAICSYSIITVNFVKFGGWSRVDIEAPEKNPSRRSTYYSSNIRNYRHISNIDTLITCFECDDIRDFSQIDIAMGRNSFQVQNLGWINCDRFLNDNIPLTQLALNETPNKDTHYFLIFKDIKSIMPDYISGDKIVFPNVPRGYQATVVGIREKDENLFFAKQDIEINTSLDRSLEFRQVTKDELKENFAKFN